jgi:hypothetical protein
LALLSVVVLVSGLVTLGGSQPASAAKLPLRQVDWRAVLKSDPKITIDPDAYKLPGGDYPFITVDATGGPEETLSGYALADDVVYGDFDGNGAEEAVLPVDSGGTGGTLGFLLYREADPAPQLVLAGTGYKMGFSAEGNRLVITEPYYVGFEANCCPSAIVRTSNTLQGGKLVALTSETSPNDVQEPTVWSFYAALGDKRFDEAYQFLSPAQQASNPFDRWKAGYADTQSIEVETAPGATPNEVQIKLTSVDSKPGGGTVTRRFTGTWTLIWNADQKRWLLDKASIRPA